MTGILGVYISSFTLKTQQKWKTRTWEFLIGIFYEVFRVFKMVLLAMSGGENMRNGESHMQACELHKAWSGGGGATMHILYL